MRVDFRRLAALKQPDDEGPEDVTEEVEEEPEQRSGVAKDRPGVRNRDRYDKRAGCP